MHQSTVFDIETEALGEKAVLASFDEGKVKLGNLKDEGKIKAKIEDARKAHLEKAALSPLTGRVLALGYETYDGNLTISSAYRDDPEGEAEVCYGFWRMFEDEHDLGRTLVGFNSARFDLPFLYRRSLILGVEIPDDVLEKGRWWSPTFIDLMEMWQCGDRQEFISMNALCLALGVQGKPDGVTGADFARLWYGSNEERAQAKEYLINDLRMTRAVADCFNV
jgi:uncharacterized protein YprB with RNaseH-like and TPR domain